MPHKADDNGSMGFLAATLALPNEDPRKIVFVAVALCLVCSVLVSTAAVALKPLQLRNETLARKAEILRVGGLYEQGGDIETLFGQVETRIVELGTGEYSDRFDPATFDDRDAARDPALSSDLDKGQDIAGIRRRSDFVPVYQIREGGSLDTVILPVHGYGLWSTMYGFLAMDSDATTIKGLTFHEHGETAGLGDQIANPRWLSQFTGKSAFDDDGQPRISVIKGLVDSQSPDARFQVDGIAGATLTSNGVTNLLQFWLGVDGFGPYLDKLRKSGG
ncbi:MAG: Na(+)-translocating NADH-quinone reductase subunit C [Pseudomonadota bacterium]|nr:Na(+)-translocating NADH-quinone reductase subunit C [Pseudomonadota bacterium]